MGKDARAAISTDPPRAPLLTRLPMLWSCWPRKELAPGLVLRRVTSAPKAEPGQTRGLRSLIQIEHPQHAGWTYQYGAGCRHAGGGMGIMHSTSGSKPEAGNG
jgi:hypothetical protein